MQIECVNEVKHPHVEGPSAELGDIKLYVNDQS